MKIKKSDLEQIIKEEALRMFQIQKLEEAQIKIQSELNLISEGKKQMNDEEINELLAGLKSVFGAGAKKVGQAVSDAGEKAKELGGKVAAKYKEGEQTAKVAKMEKQRDEIVVKIKQLADQYKQLTGKRYSMIGQKIDAVKA
jgi:hypothetical protein